MNTTRRGLAATALPLLFLGAATPGAQAKTAGPSLADACTAEDGPKACASGKAAAGGCRHCAAIAKGRR
jgi:hypothetical protein